MTSQSVCFQTCILAQLTSLSAFTDRLETQKYCLDCFDSLQFITVQKMDSLLTQKFYQPMTRQQVSAFSYVHIEKTTCLSTKRATECGKKRGTDVTLNI